MRKKILIVDDNTELLKLLCMAVRHAGFAVASATDGLQALARARSMRPDLIVLDLVLPELDGFAVCERLRREPGLTKVPVILLTGLTGEFTRFAGFESGASEYVQKPISPSELVSIIRRYLRPKPDSGSEAAKVRKAPQLSVKRRVGAGALRGAMQGKIAAPKNFFP